MKITFILLGATYMFGGVSLIGFCFWQAATIQWFFTGVLAILSGLAVISMGYHLLRDGIIGIRT